MAIGKYVITRKLAEGGMGMVYLATHPPSGMTQVVKFVLPQLARDPALRGRFERECKTAVRLRGKINIVRIESYNIDPDGDTYIVMEHLQGETLEDHLRRCGRVSKHHAFRLIAQIINALHALHNENIIHRDLKPANVFIVEDEHEAYRVKLIDFGIVHDRNAAPDGLKTRAGTLVGTPGYMALEQFGDAGNVTPAADVFALAVIIWEMFTGVLPWGYGPNEFALYERQKSEPPTLPPGHTLPPEWEQIIRLALDPNPTRRPPLHALLYALARGTPAEPPMFPASGFDMVVDYAPNVLRKTPVEVETVRATDAQRAAVSNPYWAMQRATITPSDSSNARLALRSNDMPISAPGWTPAPAPASVPTVNARPVNAAPDPASPQTTLSAAAGQSAPVAAVLSPSAGESAPVSAVSAVERKRGWRVLALAGAATTVLAFLVVAFVSSTISRRSSSAKPATLPADEPTKIETTTNTGAAGGSVPDPAPTAPAATVPSPAGANASAPPSTTAPATSTAATTPTAETKARTDSATPSTKQRTKTRATKSATSTHEPTTREGENRSRPTSNTTKSAAPGSGSGRDTFDPDAVME